MAWENEAFSGGAAVFCTLNGQLYTILTQAGLAIAEQQGCDSVAMTYLSDNVCNLVDLSAYPLSTLADPSGHPSGTLRPTPSSSENAQPTTPGGLSSTNPSLDTDDPDSDPIGYLLTLLGVDDASPTAATTAAGSPGFPDSAISASPSPEIGVGSGSTDDPRGGIVSQLAPALAAEESSSQLSGVESSPSDDTIFPLPPTPGGHFAQSDNDAGSETSTSPIPPEITVTSFITNFVTLPASTITLPATTEVEKLYTSRSVIDRVYLCSNAR